MTYPLPDLADSLDKPDDFPFPLSPMERAVIRSLDHPADDAQDRYRYVWVVCQGLVAKPVQDAARRYLDGGK